MTSFPALDGMRRAIHRIGLPAWFIAIDAAWIVRPNVLGVDALHYQRAAAEWLAGGDPWSVVQNGVPYLSGPHSLIFYAPTNLLPLTAAVVVWMALGLAAAAFAVTRLGLPIWWIAFPPLAHAIWNGNPQTLVVALLVTGGAAAASLALLLKLYVGVQLLFRPRALLIAGLVLIATLPFLPWREYLEHEREMRTHLATAWNGSAWRVPILVPFVAAGLFVLRRHGGEWLAIPALWPAIQFYYVSSVLPLVAGRPVLAALLAIPIPLMAPAVVLGLASIRVFEARSRGRPDDEDWRAGTNAPPPTPVGEQ